MSIKITPDHLSRVASSMFANRRCPKSWEISKASRGNMTWRRPRKPPDLNR
ncbi:hypothetical protein J2R96_002034 [Bradyrhizobium elkanii]|nr:hypothetical protein [Bradyrhizobium elkanii]